MTGLKALSLVFPLTRERERDKVLWISWRLLALLGAAAMILVTWALARYPAYVEQVYAEGAGPAIALALGRAAGRFPFSVVEAFFMVLLFRYAVLALLACHDVLLRQRRLLNAVQCGFWRVMTAAGVLVTLFYAGWGINFSRPDLVARMKWGAFQEELAPDDRAAELERLAGTLVDAANREYEVVAGCADLGCPMPLPVSMARIDAAVEEGFAGLAATYDLPESFALSRGPAKPVAASSVLSQFLVLGFYSPWTGEANYNWQTPATRLPQTIGHEKAHQRCVTNEDEAEFLGYLACAHSDEPFVRYSAYLYAQRQLVIELYKLDRDRAAEVIKKRLPGVQRDSDAFRDFLLAHLGFASVAGQSISDIYLKANRVSSGVMSYEMSARLLVLYSRATGGSCIPPSQRERPPIPEESEWDLIARAGAFPPAGA